jgi:integrase
MTSSPTIPLSPILKETMLAQPTHVQGISSTELESLIISVRTVDGTMLVVSRYGDDIWWPTGATTNLIKARTKLDFTKTPLHFKDVTKAIMYRYLRKGRAGSMAPSVSTLVKVLQDVSIFLKFVDSLGIRKLSDITATVCSSYAQACKDYRTRKSAKRAPRPLSSDSIIKRLRAVELIYKLSQYTNEVMPQHPWQGSSAERICGSNAGGEKTPLIPDEVFTILFQRAWSTIAGAEELLDLRDKIETVAIEHAELNRAGKIYRQNLCLRDHGWSGNLQQFKTKLIEIRTACYIVIASLSGCRNHELAFLSENGYYSTEDDDGERYWWLRSKSTKTDEGETEWMIPEAAVAALRIMTRWAAPFQALLRKEIHTLRAADSRDVRIAYAQDHEGALFVGFQRMTGRVGTLGLTALNNELNKFAKSCGLGWKITSHQFRRKFANYAARSQFGDLRYLREHFKHWEIDMTLGYAMNESQEMALYLEIQDELEEIKESLVATWLNGSEPLTGGYGNNIVNWRDGNENVTLFKNHAQMVRSIAQSTSIRSNGHAWCTADDNQCIGNDLEPTRCGNECSNAVIGLRHVPIYKGLYDQLKQLEKCDDIGEGGKARVRRDLTRCASVLTSLGYDPIGALT